EGVGLHGPVGGDDTVWMHVVLARDPLDEPRIAGRGAVGERARGVALEGGLRGGAQAVDVDDVERGGAAREGDVGELSHRPPHDSRCRYTRVPRISTAISDTCVGLRPTRTPLAS